MKKAAKGARNIFFLFFFSYVIVLTIPIFIGGMIYFRAEKVLETQTSNANMAMLSQMRQTIDAHIDEVQKLSDQISTNQKIRSLTYSSKPITSEDRAKIYDVVQSFASYKYITPFIDDFYVYLKNIDYVITSSSSANSEFFYQTYNPSSDNYVDWKNNIISKNHNGQYYIAQSVLTSQQAAETLIFLNSFQFVSGDSPIGNIGVMIQTKKFEDLLSSIKGISGGSAYIIDSSNHVMASNTSTNIKESDLPRYEDMTLENDIFETKIGSEKYVISYIASQENDWKYITAFPQNIIQEKLNYFRSLAVSSIIVCISLSIILILILSYRNYHPIDKIIKYLDDNGNEKKDTSHHNFRYIENAVVKIVDSNNQYLEKFEHYTPLIRSNLILRLIKGRISENESWEKMLSFSNITFLYDRFSVILFSIENCNESAEPNYGLGLIRTMVINISEENIMEYSEYSVNSVELENGTIAMLLNISSVDSTNLKLKVTEIVEKTKKHIEENYHTVMTAGIGGIYEHYEDIKISYQEAEKALDYKILKGISTIICYDEIGSEAANYKYSTEMETQLINFVKVGDSIRAQKLLKEIFDLNFNDQMPLQKIRCLYFDIISTAIKTLDDFQFNDIDVFGQSFNPIDKLLECQTVQEMYELLQYIYQKLCNYININKKSHNDVLLQQIIKYIDIHYVDENLSQVQIADYFEISPTYLSNFFKEQIGEKMTNYIAKVKVEKAKTLLCDTSLTINKIAQMVGCSNVMTMIRIFKKIEGITPGQYRDSLK